MHWSIGLSGRICREWSSNGYSYFQSPSCGCEEADTVREAVDLKYCFEVSTGIRHEDMFKHMKAIVAGDDPAVKHGKPAPDIYLEAASQLGVEPKDCLVFEDALSGVKAGKAAGCTVVAVPDPRMDKALFDGLADVVLNSLDEFDGKPWGINLTERN